MPLSPVRSTFRPSTRALALSSALALLCALPEEVRGDAAAATKTLMGSGGKDGKLYISKLTRTEFHGCGC